MKLMSHNLYFIQEHLQTEPVQHGGIGCKDIERILIRSGFKPIEFPYHSSYSIKAKLLRLAFLLRVVLALPRDAVVFFQTPLYARIHVMLLKLLVWFRKSITIVCCITDINGLKDGDEHLLRDEQRFFRMFRKFIVHNTVMKQWLLHFHPGAQVSLLEFFDFLVQPNYNNRICSKEIAFAGFLDKSRFIWELDRLKGLQFNLFGPFNNPIPDSSLVVKYYGAFSPEAMPHILKGSYGLVWDGDSIEGLFGIFGLYNHFITPHKLSLYILAGMPVIAHKSSGAAEIIERYHVGFSVTSLLELNSRIEKMSPEEYKEMVCNCHSLSKRISKGHCLIQALERQGIKMAFS